MVVKISAVSKNNGIEFNQTLEDERTTIQRANFSKINFFVNRLFNFNNSNCERSLASNELVTFLRCIDRCSTDFWRAKELTDLNSEEKSELNSILKEELK